MPVVPSPDESTAISVVTSTSDEKNRPESTIVMTPAVDIPPMYEEEYTAPPYFAEDSASKVESFPVQKTSPGYVAASPGAFAHPMSSSSLFQPPQNRSPPMFQQQQHQPPTHQPPMHPPMIQYYSQAGQPPAVYPNQLQAAHPPAVYPNQLQVAPPSLLSSVTQATNGISIFTEKDSLAGTYLIDPLLPMSFATTMGGSRKEERKKSRAEREHSREAHRAEDGWSRDWGFKNTGGQSPNAAFRTRNGNITLDLHIVTSVPFHAGGGPQGQVSSVPAFVSASSRHADIIVNVVEIQSGRTINLDVGTRTGNILVLVPASYSGTITFHTGHKVSGTHTQILANLAQRAHVLQKTDREAVVSIQGTPGVTPGANWNGPASLAPSGLGQDRCVISTRTGRVAVGLSGVDRVDPNATWNGKGTAPHRLGKAVEIGLFGANYYL